MTSSTITREELRLQGFDLIDDDKLRDYIRRSCGTNWHYSSSCRMGDLSDPMVVCDPQLRVRGVSGLRVALSIRMR